MTLHVTSTKIIIIFKDIFFLHDSEDYLVCILDWVDDNKIHSRKYVSCIDNNTSVQTLEVFSEEDYIALKLAFS